MTKTTATTDQGKFLENIMHQKDIPESLKLPNLSVQKAKTIVYSTVQYQKKTSC